MTTQTYLDHAATTPMLPEVLEAMRPYWSESFGNPSSLHAWGRTARAGLDQARSSAANALGVPTRSVFFTRGGTEADNLAVLGAARAALQDGDRPRVVTSAVEHPAVFEAARKAVEEGAEHVVIPTKGGAPMDLSQLEEALVSGGAVLSAIWVNNEVGLVLPMEEIAELGRRHGVLIHSDGVQAVGKVPVDTSLVDLLTVTGHKIGGPKGTGLLLVPNSSALLPLVHGGGQERGLRPGTEDVAGAVGLAKAVELALARQPSESARLETLRDDLESGLQSRLDGVHVHGEGQVRAPHISSLRISGVNGSALLMALDLEGIAASGGSACSSGAQKPSRVLQNLYGDVEGAVLRLSLGSLVGADDIPSVVDRVVTVVERLREGGSGS